MLTLTCKVRIACRFLLIEKYFIDPEHGLLMGFEMIWINLSLQEVPRRVLPSKAGLHLLATQVRVQDVR